MEVSMKKDLKQMAATINITIIIIALIFLFIIPKFDFLIFWATLLILANTSIGIATGILLLRTNHSR